MAALTAAALMDRLVYASYRANREASPDVPVHRWKLIYANVDAMEERYQREVNEYAETMIRRDQLARWEGR